MIFIVHPDRTVTTIAETLHVGDTSADVTVLSPFSGVQNCMLKFLLPTGEEGTPQFLNYYGDGTDLGLGYEGSVYTMKIPAVMTKVAGAVQVQIIFTDTGAQQFASEIATFTVSGIEVLPFPDSEEQGEDFAAQLLAMQATLAVAMEAAKVGGTVCKFTTLSSNTTITLQNLVGMTSIDWGDGTVDNALSHTYAEAGTYTCYIAGLTDIGANAFANITALKDIVIGDGVKSIGVGAFQACTGLISASIGNGVTSIGSSAFVACAGLKRITIPDSIAIIGEAAFSTCTGLKSIVVGGGVIIIGALAFASCSSLVQIVFNGTTPPAMNNANALGGTNNCPIFVPYKCLAAYQTAYADYASRIVVTDTQPLTGAADPTTSTATEYVGKVYINTTTNAAFVCTNINAGVYTWQPIMTSAITVDSALSSSSENPVQNKVVKDALDGKQDTLTFDDAPTAGSNNPVKSGGIKTALDGKQATLTFDNAPTANSDNPVKSGGVKSALDLKANASDVYTKAQVDSKISAVFRYKGSVATVADLDNVQDPAIGDVYTVTADGSEYVCTGTSPLAWQYLGVSVDLSGKLDKVTTSGTERAYGVNAAGAQVMIDVSASADANTLAKRDANGQVAVPQTPTADGQAASKKYVDDGLALKQNTLTFDNAPTANSDNPVKSGGIKTALDAKQDTLTAGNGIDITNGVISATGGGGATGTPAIIFTIKTTSANTAVTFTNLTGLSSVDWGDGNTDATASHTYAAAGIYTVIAYGVTGIGNGSASCVSPTSVLKKVIICESVTSIGDYAFHNCTNLESAIIETGATLIGSAFYNCTGLKEVKLPNTLTSIYGRAFYNCLGLKEVKIPNSVTLIDSLAFYACAGLSEVLIPYSVTRINGSVFASCTNLWKIIFERNSPPTLDTNVFYNTNNCKIYVPRASISTYKAASNYTTYASRIVANATTDDLAGKQDTLTAGTGIDITNNVISVTGGGGGSSWTEIDGGANTQITSYAFSVNKKYEIFAMAYHPMFSDLTPMSTPTFVLDTDSSIMAQTLYVTPAFQNGATGDQQLEVAPDLGQWSPIYFQWVLASDKSASGWKIKVYYRELAVAT